MAEQQAENIDLVIRSSSDKKYNVALSPSATVSELKALVAAQSEIPQERQRLIYSGRVLKDADTLESYKITKSGLVIHLVKGAAPPGSNTSSTSATTGAGTTNSSSAAGSIPTNLAAGTGSGNMLADLTGARYAGFAQLPSASMFGPDGGMGPTPNPEDMIRLMETPGFSENIQQALQNPQFVDMIINSTPQLRNMGPQFREMLQNDNVRQMLTNPQMFRQVYQMGQVARGLGLDGAPGQGGSSFPAPGDAGATSTTGDNAADNTAGAATGAGAAASNPFAALLGGGGFGGANAGGDAGAGTGAAPPMFNPELLASLFGGQQGSQGLAAPVETDTRPPEERYENQLRQLNELGFVDFERNVRALRRSGGHVQGAVEALLDGQV